MEIYFVIRREELGIQTYTRKTASENHYTVNYKVQYVCMYMCVCV
jgi:hypothetical protein